MKNEYLNVGYIIATHGLRGALKVKPATSFIDERFEVGATLYVKKKDSDEILPLTIENASMYKGVLTLTFSEILDINEAEEFLKSTLLVKKDTAKLAAGYFYLDDLLHMQVKLEDETLIGEVVEILEYASYVTLRVRRKNANDLLIPYIDEFIVSTDLDSKTIVFRPIEGML